MIIVPVPRGGGGTSSSGAWALGALAGLLIGMPLWALIFSFVGEVTGIGADYLIRQWWGFAAFLGLMTLLSGLILITAMATGEICDRIARKKGSHANDR